MSSPGLDRRQMLGAATLLAATVPAAGAMAQSAAAPAVTFMPKPLPFDPKSVPGLSEKMLVSHHDNNYTGAVRRLGTIVTQFKALDPATAPVFQINGLKREELLAWNSMILHELYFAGLGGGARASAPLAAAIERDFGSEARWRAEFTGMGKALGGGSGWVLLTWNHRDNQLVNQWAADHTMTFAGGTPILGLDMYEHAYAIDYGSNAGGYVDAFMGGINWATANQTFGRVSPN